MPHPFLTGEIPLVIGHRGCAGEAPENTLAAFERGLSQGAVILESDVHLTRDLVPVLIHDHDVERCTEGKGLVRDFDLRELQTLDAGFRFREEQGAPARGKGHRVPALAEALRGLPRARFNLELKENVGEIVERTLDVIEASGHPEQVLLTAEDDALMAATRSQVARRGLPVALGACLGEVVSFVRGAAEGGEPAPGPMALQIPARFGDRPLVTARLVEFAHARDVQVHVWTINDPAEMTELLALGVDGIVSDYPGRVAALADGQSP